MYHGAGCIDERNEESKMTTGPVEIEDHFPKLTFDYTNHRGEKSVRVVVSPTIFWGQSDYYPEPQWLLNAFDLVKNAWRTFAVARIIL